MNLRIKIYIYLLSLLLPEKRLLSLLFYTLLFHKLIVYLLSCLIGHPPLTMYIVTSVFKSKSTKFIYVDKLRVKHSHIFKMAHRGSCPFVFMRIVI